MLSIDGGGIRGIIPLTILSEIERLTDTPIANLFDLMVGTSTGGIIALALSVPRSDESPRYSSQFIKELYEKRGGEIFKQNLFRNLFNFKGLFGPKYSSKHLKKVLEEYFSGATLREAITDTMVTSYDLESRQPYFIKSYKDRDSEILMSDAALATGAAPTYFPPVEVYGKVLVDGGVFVNNPTISAIVEAEKLFPDAEQLIVVSLGTGKLTESYSLNNSESWGVLKWAPIILDVVFDGVSDAVDYQAMKLTPYYFRFQGMLRECSDKLDDVRPENIRNLNSLAEEIIAKNRVKFDELVNILSTPSGL